MRGTRLSAATLHRYGLINELAAAGQAIGAALTLAADLNARPSNALSDIKELIAEAQTQPLSAHLEREKELFMRNLVHPNAGEGIAAFLEKRSPRFR
jgi:enoyl-CoA hydratase/carnithine racemase